MKKKTTCLPCLCQRFCIIKIAKGYERLVSLDCRVTEKDKGLKKNGILSQKKALLVAQRRTNFELEIEDRGHLADL